MEEYQDYKVITAKGSSKLSELVTQELEMGYVPYGELVVNQTYLGDDEEGNPKMFVMMHQAMVLPFDDEDDSEE